MNTYAADQVSSPIAKGVLITFLTTVTGIGTISLAPGSWDGKSAGEIVLAVSFFAILCSIPVCAGTLLFGSFLYRAGFTRRRHLTVVVVLATLGSGILLLSGFTGWLAFKISDVDPQEQSVNPMLMMILMVAQVQGILIMLLSIGYRLLMGQRALADHAVVV